MLYQFLTTSCCVLKEATGFSAGVVANQRHRVASLPKNLRVAREPAEATTSPLEASRFTRGLDSCGSTLNVPALLGFPGSTRLL
jgi:hypothetical protein